MATFWWKSFKFGLYSPRIPKEYYQYTQLPNKLMVGIGIFIEKNWGRCKPHNSKTLRPLPLHPLFTTCAAFALAAPQRCFLTPVPRFIHALQGKRVTLALGSGTHFPLPIPILQRDSSENGMGGLNGWLEVLGISLEKQENAAKKGGSLMH